MALRLTHLLLSCSRYDRQVRHCATLLHELQIVLCFCANRMQLALLVPEVLDLLKMLFDEARIGGHAVESRWYSNIQRMCAGRRS